MTHVERPLHLYAVVGSGGWPVAVTPGFDLGDAMELASDFLGIGSIEYEDWEDGENEAVHVSGARVRLMAMELGQLEVRIAIFQSAQDGAFFR